jgi:hypothetical protein
MKDKGPNDLEKNVFDLTRENFKLKEEINMLKKDIIFLTNLLRKERKNGNRSIQESNS